MKCDVCGTKIPIAESTCPNCGYRVKKDVVQSFDASNKTHEHIRTQSTKTYVKPNIPDMSMFQTPKWIIGIAVAFVVAVIIMTVLPLLLKSSRSSSDWSEMTFQEVIDLGEGEGTIELAQSSLEKVQNLMSNTLHIEDIYTHEYCSDYDDSVNASFSVQGYSQDVYYSVNYTYVDRELLSSELTISGTSQKSIKDLETLPMNKDIVTKLGDYMDIHNAYEYFDQGRLKLVKLKDYNDQYEYVHSQNPYVFIHEKVYSRNEFEYYCTISSR